MARRPPTIRPRSCCALEPDVSPSARRDAKKSLGQHFLIDPNLQQKIVNALEPEDDDRVIELGPGQGALTRHLAERVGKLVAIELDDTLVEGLRADFADRDHVVIHHGDALEQDMAGLAGGEPYKVIGNIPYGITSPLIFHLLAADPRPRRIVLTIQKEVAERLVAQPGGKDYGALTVGVQAVARVETLFRVSRGAFRPRPAVDSQAVRITPLRPPPLSRGEEAAFRRLTRAAFSRRRKQLQRVLRQAPEYALSGPAAEAVLRSLDIDPATRPDALPVGDYLRLAKALEQGG